MTHARKLCNSPGAARQGKGQVRKTSALCFPLPFSLGKIKHVYAKGGRKMTQYFSLDGAKMATARRRAQVSTDELARRCGITSTRLYQLQRGGQQVRPGTLRKIAEALGMEPGDLVAEG